MKRLATSSLTLLLLFLISHGIHHDEKMKDGDPKTNAIISLGQFHEDLPGPDQDDKKTPFFQPAVLPFALTLHLIITVNQNNSSNTAISAFLTAVFFQSNYVIKPL